MCFPFSSNIVAHLLLINIPHFTDVGCKGIMLATPTELNEMIFFSISQKNVNSMTSRLRSHGDHDP